jgi:hypothetical protein
VKSPSVESDDEAGASRTSCELKEAFAEDFCCFIWLAAYERKPYFVNVKEE